MKISVSVKVKSVKMSSKSLKFRKNWYISGGPGGHPGVSEACWVLCALLKALGAASGAVLGGSWALLGAILGRPGRQLGVKLAPKRAPEAHNNDLEKGTHFPHPQEPHFSVFYGFWVPTWVHVGIKITSARDHMSKQPKG